MDGAAAERRHTPQVGVLIISGKAVVHRQDDTISGCCITKICHPGEFVTNINMQQWKRDWPG